MHSGADIDITGHRKLTHTDIDLLHVRNQSLRWILIDELPMISDELLGSFEYSITNAADKHSHFKIRSDGSIRIFGGYNVLMFGDFYQIPPIPSSGTLAIPLAEKKPPSEAAKTALNILWGEGVNALNYFAELTIQKRIDDKWYSKLMEACRYGALSNESYNFLVGLPTEHAGSWCSDRAGDGEV